MPRFIVSFSTLIRNVIEVQIVSHLKTVMTIICKLLVLILSVTLSACGMIGPVAYVDYSGLGSSEIAKIIASKILSSPNHMNEAVRDRIKDIDPLQQESARQAYTSLGFECETGSSTKCRYSGSTKFELRNVSSSLSALNAHTKHVDIVIDYREKPIKIEIEFTRSQGTDTARKKLHSFE